MSYMYGVLFEWCLSYIHKRWQVLDGIFFFHAEPLLQ